jgi:hypothetical protein
MWKKEIGTRGSLIPMPIKKEQNVIRDTPTISKHTFFMQL